MNGCELGRAIVLRSWFFVLRSAIYIFVVVLSLAVSRAAAAPPSVTYLTPAGAQRGTEVDVVAGGTFDTWPVDVWTSGEGLRFEPGKKKGQFKVSVDPAAVPGPRWVRFTNELGSSVARPFYVGAIAEMQEKEPNELRKQATVVGERPMVVNGALGTSGDVDLFQVVLKQGATFVASVDANYGLGSSIDCLLQLLDEAGNVVAQNIDDRGLDPRIVFAVPRDGTYYVRMFGFTAVPATAVKYAGGEDAVYRLTLTSGPFVDFAFPPLVSPGDVQPVTLRGWNLPDDLKPVSLPKAEASRRVRWLPHDFAGVAAVGAVNVPLTVATETNAAGSPRKLEFPTAVAATLRRPGERHEYVLTGKKGSPVRIRVVSRTLGFPLDALVKIYKPDGTLQIRLDDTAKEPDVDALLAPPLDGDYRLTVEDLFGNGGERYAYVLDVRPAASDFALSFAAAELTAEVGKPFEVAVNVDRPVPLTTDIGVRLLGLPEDFGAVEVVSVGKGPEAKTSAKKVVVKITPTKTFRGPIRAVGTVADEAKTERTATAPSTVVPTQRLDEAWLTVVPAGKLPAPAAPAKKK
jgi:hypothetical protein